MIPRIPCRAPASDRRQPQVHKRDRPKVSNGTHRLLVTVPPPVEAAVSVRCLVERQPVNDNLAGNGFGGAICVHRTTT